MVHQSLRLVLCAGLCAALLGCGSGTGFKPATGKVTYKGQPVVGATVNFIPDEGTPAVGVTNDKGEFSINTRGELGTKVGRHRVGISKYDTSGMMANPKPEDMQKMMGRDGRMPVAKSLLPTKYAAPQLSGLEANVTADASKNVFNFDLVD